MADLYLIVRTWNRKNSRSIAEGRADTDDRANNIGDVIEVRPSGHPSASGTPLERKAFFFIRVTDVPEPVAKKVANYLTEPALETVQVSCLRPVFEGSEEEEEYFEDEEIVLIPRVFSLIPTNDMVQAKLWIRTNYAAVASWLQDYFNDAVEQPVDKIPAIPFDVLKGKVWRKDEARWATEQEITE